MNKKLLLGLAFSLVLGLTGCSDDDKDDPKPSQGTNIKTSISSGYHWDKDSKIGVYTIQEKNPLVNQAWTCIKTSEDGKQAEFKNTLDLEQSKIEFYAYYPHADRTGQSITDLKVNLPKLQKQDKVDPNENTNVYAFFQAKDVITPETNFASKVIAFENIFSTLNLNIDTKGELISEIILTVENESLAGTFDYSLKDQKFVVIDNSKIDVSESITLQIDKSANQANKARIVVNPIQLEGKKLEFTIKTDKDTHNIVKEGFKLEGNKHYTIDLSLDKELNSPKINLSENGTANSYMVNQPNTLYMFDAKVQGNGKSTPSITPKAINPKEAFVLWETSEKMYDVVKDVKLTNDGFVTFSTTDNIGGNALIVVTDGEVTNEFPKGTILWSWHIWSTDYTEANDVEVTSNDQKFQFMTLNLGSTNESYAGSDFGLKYQWGRKDPFMWSGIGYDNDVEIGVVHEEMYGWQAETYTADAGESKAVEATIMFPAAFFRAGQSTGFDWFGSGSEEEGRNNNLWGNPEDNNGSKSIYDPCPAGYRIPPHAAFDSFTKDNGTFENEVWKFNLGAASISFNVETSYVMYNTGKIVGKGGPDGYTSYYWTSSANPTFNKVNASSFMLEKNFISNNQTSQRALGGTIRCIRDVK